MGPLSVLEGSGQKRCGQLVAQQETSSLASLNSICDMSFNLHRNNMKEKEDEDDQQRGGNR